MFDSFRELNEDELRKLYRLIAQFRNKEKDWYDFISSLPKGNILTLTHPECNEYHKWMLRDGYYNFKNQYGSRFARKIARELIQNNGMGYI